MTDGLAGRCGYTFYLHLHDPSQSDHASCCYRKTWRDYDRCIWHAKIEEPLSKSTEELQETRETEPNQKLNSKRSVMRGSSHIVPSEILDGANLPEVDIRDALDFKTCSLRGTNFRSSNLTGINLQEADLRNTNFKDAVLTDANLQGADLADANLEGVDLTDANLRETNLSFANLRGADLSEADLREADFTRSNLRKANISNANLVESDLSTTDSVNANLSNADLSYVNYRGSDLRGADLANTILDSADFSGSNLQGANFTGSFSDNANFEGAKLRGEDSIKKSLDKRHKLRKRIRYIGLLGATFIILVASVPLLQNYYQINTPPTSLEDIMAVPLLLVILLLYGYLGSLFIQLIRNAEGALVVIGNESGE